VGLELRSSDSGANVIVAEPFDRAADLLIGPGRGPAEAEALMSWMERNQDAWRT
jgi:hypothetical protein